MSTPIREENPTQMECGRVAVLSDVHANYPAFKACIDDALEAGADGFIFLGDYVTGLAGVTQTLDLLYHLRQEYPTLCVRGNRERYLLEQHIGGFPFKQGSNTGSCLFTDERLRPWDRAFFAGLPIYHRVIIRGVLFEVAHATRDNDRVYFEREDAYIAEVFRQMEASYLLTGHSHKQYQCTHQGKTIINPGAVGLPQGGDNRAQYALIEIGEGAVHCTFRRVSYDIRKTIQDQFQSGLMNYAPCWAAGELYSVISGEGQTEQLLNKMFALAEEDARVLDDEHVWRRNLADLGMSPVEEDILIFYEQHKQR